jgi:recombinational DNA repair ATPase RecF
MQGETPIILLLDDIISHLDLRHRMLLFKELERFEKVGPLRGRTIQTWITGTDKEVFAFLEGKADFCEIQHP